MTGSPALRSFLAKTLSELYPSAVPVRTEVSSGSPALRSFLAKTLSELYPSAVPVRTELSAFAFRARGAA